MAGGPHRAQKITEAPEFRLMIIAVAVFALMSILSPDRFLSTQNLTSMAFQFPEFAILALAMTITMMTGGIDLSVVGVSNFSAIVAAIILTTFADPGMTTSQSLFWLGIAVVVSLSIGAACGLANGILVAHFGLPPILATLGFIPGLVIALVLYWSLNLATGLPLVMNLPTATFVLLGTIAACALSGFLASRRLASADPAELF